MYSANVLSTEDKRKEVHKKSCKAVFPFRSADNRGSVSMIADEYKIAIHFQSDTQDGETDMDDHNGKYSGKALLITFLTGAAVGAIAGILLTDRSGQETRWELEDYAKKKQQDLIKKAKEVRAALDDAIERGKTFITEKRSGSGAV